MKVLLATDGSSHAEQAAAFLCRLPHAEPLELTVMTNIFIPAASANSGMNSWIPEFRQQQHAAAGEHFESVAAMFEGANATVEHHVEDGDIGHSIVELAKKSKTDLVVLGAKGHSMIDRILLGSVSDHVAEEAPCSVLIVRPPSDQQRSQERLDITISSDPSAVIDPLVLPFRSFHFGDTVQGHVLSIVPVIRTFRQDLLPAAATNLADEHTHALQHAKRLTEALAEQDVHFTSKAIEAEHVGEAVVKFVKKHDSDLIMVGDSHRSAMQRLAFGSTWRYVSRHAPCSVWIARSEPHA